MGGRRGRAARAGGAGDDAGDGGDADGGPPPPTPPPAPPPSLRLLAAPLSHPRGSLAAPRRDIDHRVVGQRVRCHTNAAGSPDGRLPPVIPAGAARRSRDAGPGGATSPAEGSRPSRVARGTHRSEQPAPWWFHPLPSPVALPPSWRWIESRFPAARQERQRTQETVRGGTCGRERWIWRRSSRGDASPRPGQPS